MKILNTQQRISRASKDLKSICGSVSLLIAHFPLIPLSLTSHASSSSFPLSSYAFYSPYLAPHLPSFLHSSHLMPPPPPFLDPSIPHIYPSRLYSSHHFFIPHASCLLFPSFLLHTSYQSFILHPSCSLIYFHIATTYFWVLILLTFFL